MKIETLISILCIAGVPCVACSGNKSGEEDAAVDPVVDTTYVDTAVDPDVTPDEVEDMAGDVVDDTAGDLDAVGDVVDDTAGDLDAVGDVVDDVTDATPDFVDDGGEEDVVVDPGTDDGSVVCDTSSPLAGCLSTGGTETSQLCCESAGDWPNLCTTGPCGCAPAYSHEVKICACPLSMCFDGSCCVPI